MKLFIARVALLSSFAFGALLGGGVALDGGQVAFTGAEGAEARAGRYINCDFQIIIDGVLMPHPDPACW